MFVNVTYRKPIGFICRALAIITDDFYPFQREIPVYQELKNEPYTLCCYATFAADFHFAPLGVILLETLIQYFIPQKS